MNVGGNFDGFADVFDNRLLPAVFAMVIEEWPRAPRPTAKPIENRITNRFVGHLSGVIRKRKLPSFTFVYRQKLADPDVDSESGEIDICVHSCSCHPEAFFGFECKCLNVQTKRGLKSKAGAYVSATGMGCFVSGQYPTTSGFGGMLGYVMDRDVASAIVAINKALKRKKDTLRLTSSHCLEPAVICPGSDDVFETAHETNGHSLLIYHLLLPF